MELYVTLIASTRRVFSKSDGVLLRRGSEEFLFVSGTIFFAKTTSQGTPECLLVLAPLHQYLVKKAKRVATNPISPTNLVLLVKECNGNTYFFKVLPSIIT
jgi:hypothetical protein